jgi:hypothetical protein
MGEEGGSRERRGGVEKKIFFKLEGIKAKIVEKNDSLRVLYNNTSLLTHVFFSVSDQPAVIIQKKQSHYR